MAETNIRVRVKAPYRVVSLNSGKPYSDGDELTVPASIADEWLHARFVELVISTS